MYEKNGDIARSIKYGDFTTIDEAVFPRTTKVVEHLPFLKKAMPQLAEKMQVIQEYRYSSIKINGSVNTKVPK